MPWMACSIAHDGADGLHGQLAVVDQVFGVGADVRVVGARAKGGHRGEIRVRGKARKHDRFKTTDTESFANHLCADCSWK